MDIALAILAFVLSVIGCIGAIAPLIPGVVVSWVGLLVASFCDHSDISPALLWIWAGVTVIVTAVDFLLPGLIARAMGGSRAGMIGATVGVIAGFFFGFGIAGVILGPFFGAVLGELLHDRKNSARAFRAGFGSFLAFIAGTGLKLTASIWMFSYIWADTWAAAKSWFVTTF